MLHFLKYLLFFESDVFFLIFQLCHEFPIRKIFAIFFEELWSFGITLGNVLPIVFLLNCIFEPIFHILHIFPVLFLLILQPCFVPSDYRSQFQLS